MGDTPYIAVIWPKISKDKIEGKQCGPAAGPSFY